MLRTPRFSQIHRVMQQPFAYAMPQLARRMVREDPPAGGAPAPATFTKEQLDAEVARATSGLATKNSDLIGRLKVADGYKKLAGDRSPEEIQADLDLAKDVREKKAKAEGDFDSLKTQMATAHQKELLAEKTAREQAENRVFKLLATNTASEAITKLGAPAKVLLPHVLPNLKVVEENGELVARVVDAKGNVRTADGAGTPMSIEQLVETFRADKEFGGLFPPSGASGSGARNEGGAPGNQGGSVITIPKTATTEEYRRLKAQAEKEGRPYKVSET